MNGQHGAHRTFRSSPRTTPKASAEVPRKAGVRRVRPFPFRFTPLYFAIFTKSEPVIFAGFILPIIDMRILLTSNNCRSFRRKENMRERFVSILEHKKLTAKKLEELS